jgi:hypothetical protein
MPMMDEVARLAAGCDNIRVAVASSRACAPVSANVSAVGLAGAGGTDEAAPLETLTRAEQSSLMSQLMQQGCRDGWWLPPAHDTLFVWSGEAAPCDGSANTFDGAVDDAARSLYYLASNFVALPPV